MDKTLWPKNEGIVVVPPIDYLGLILGGTALVLQNDPYNHNVSYPWTLVAAVGVTSTDVPTHIPFAPRDIPGMKAETDVGIRCERIGCIKKEWLQTCLGQVSVTTLRRVEIAVQSALGFS